jgi:hypothetical protein
MNMNNAGVDGGKGDGGGGGTGNVNQPPLIKIDSAHQQQIAAALSCLGVHSPVVSAVPAPSNPAAAPGATSPEAKEGIAKATGTRNKQLDEGQLHHHQQQQQQQQQQQ